MGPNDHELFDPPKSNKAGFIKAAIAGVLAVAVGGAGATVALPLLNSEEAAVPVEPLADSGAAAPEKAEKKSKKAKSKKSKGGKKGKDGGSSSDLIDLDPMVVSLLGSDSQGRAVSRLRMQVSLEMAPDLYGDGTRQRVRHAFIAAVQRVDVAILRSPGGVDQLRDVLREAATEALGPDVRDVYITEFIVL